MATLPTDVVSWATDDVDPTKEPTRTEPPSEIQRTGLLKGQPMGRQWFNYILWNICENLRMLKGNKAIDVANRVGVMYTFNVKQADLAADATHWTETVSGSNFIYTRKA